MIRYDCEPEMCEIMKGKLVICEDCLKLIEMVNDKTVVMEMKKYDSKFSPMYARRDKK